MKTSVVLTGIITGILLSFGSVRAEQTLNSTKVSKAPVVDGSGSDAEWQSAEAITMMDKVADESITIKSVYTYDSVFFLVWFPDPVADELHKPWVWNKELEAYKTGPQREDGFSFKWSMMEHPVDLSSFSDDDYTADVWYWKANRTNPAGYADDKYHVLSGEAKSEARETTSKSGRKRYLLRVEDAGTSAQKKRIMTAYGGDVIDQYEPRQPDGSRADVVAKGVWKDGFWTIELGRKLDTGHDDDVQFSIAPGKKYLFGVSIYGLYGEPVDRTKPHLYGQGRISETLYLRFR